MNRRPPFRFLPLCLAALLLGAGAPLRGAAGRAERPLVSALDSVAITVSDLDRALDFYTRVLPFRKLSDVETDGDAVERLQGLFGVRVRVARLQLGDEHLELVEYVTPRGRPVPADSRSNDRWFQHVAIIVSDMDRAYEHLRRHRVAHASPAPQRLPDWNPNAGGIRAFYFRDPDGHPLEILQFPPDKGNPKWRKADGRLFLGIDHTAIVVEDTETSLRFYRDRLGMRVAGASENYGPEQERLNNVFGARLRITALRAAEGPGVEFLEYLTPRDGRPYPADARPNDLVHWQTQFRGEDLDRAWSLLAGARTLFLSPGPVDLAGAGLGISRAIALRDPDGHALRIGR